MMSAANVHESTVSEMVYGSMVPEGPLQEQVINDYDDSVLRRNTFQLAIFVVASFWLYRKVSKTISDLNKRTNRKEVVPGFPSSPGAHWLVGHLILLRGSEDELKPENQPGTSNGWKKTKTSGAGSDADNDEEHDQGEPSAEITKSFVRGYERVYVDHADPETGMGSYWFFHIPCVSLLRGKDARKVMLSSSYRRSAWLVNNHTKQFLGQKALLTLMKKEWRYFRNAVHKSFTSEVVKESRPFVYQVGKLLADVLVKKTKNSNSNESSSSGYICNNNSSRSSSTMGTTMVEDESVSDYDSEDGAIRASSPTLSVPSTGAAVVGDIISVLPLMKMAAIDVFGLVALRSNGVDFGCTQNLQLSPIASAFDYLTMEYTRRLKRPWDPLSFLYGIPTKANRDYRWKRNLIREFISEQIAQTRERIAECKAADATNSYNRNHDDKKQFDLLTNLITAADSEKLKSQQQAEGCKRMDDKADDEALGDVLMTLLFAGYDTTSISLTYALYLLAKNPIKRVKCLEEIDAVLDSNDRDSQNNHNDNQTTLPPGPDELPYTKAVVLESLRLFPPAPSTARTIEKPTTIGGENGGGGGGSRNNISSNGTDSTSSNTTTKSRKVTLKEGQMVFLPIWSIQRSALNYPRPNDMIPERWVRKKRSTDNGAAASLWEVRPEDDGRKGHGVDRGDAANNIDMDEEYENDDDSSIPPANRDAFCAFAAGARNCVGKNLAVEEAVILLACLIRKLSFELVSETYEVSPSIHAVVQQPKDNLPMIVRPRR